MAPRPNVVDPPGPRSPGDRRQSQDTKMIIHYKCVHGFNGLRRCDLVGPIHVSKTECNLRNVNVRFIHSVCPMTPN